jgi:hypothetical protein
MEGIEMRDHDVHLEHHLVAGETDIGVTRLATPYCNQAAVESLARVRYGNRNRPRPGRY